MSELFLSHSHVVAVLSHSSKYRKPCGHSNGPWLPVADQDRNHLLSSSTPLSLLASFCIPFQLPSQSGKTETPTEAKWKCISPHLICRGAGTQRILDPDSQLIVQPKERRPPAWWSCDCPWGIWPAFPRRKLYREVLPSIPFLPFPDRLGLSHHISRMLRLAICSYSLMKARWLVIPLNKPSVECCLHLRRQITDGWDIRSDSSFGCLVGWSSLLASDCSRVLHIHCCYVPLG